MTPAAIRPFAAADAAALHAVRAAAFVPVFASFRELVGEEIGAVAFASAEAEQAALLDSLIQPDEAREVWLACTGDDIAGFVVASFDAAKRLGEIVLTAVHPNHAGAGIGTILNRHALQRMKDRGMAVATVGTGGDPSHAPARRAYEKAGFSRAIPSVYYYRVLDA